MSVSQSVKLPSTPQDMGRGPHNQPWGTTRRPTPIPRLQFFILVLIIAVDPLAGTMIYPFINQLIREFGITKGDDRKTGYYAGIIVCKNHIILHLLTEDCTGIPLFRSRVINRFTLG